MGILEFILVILVSVWTLIFVILALILIIVLIAIRKILGKVNKILEETEYVAKKVDLPSKIVVSAIMAYLAKNSIKSLKDLVVFFLPKIKRKKRKGI